MGRTNNYHPEQWWKQEPTDRQKRNRYFKEIASVAAGGDREEAKRINKALRLQEYQERKEVKPPTYMGMTDEELDKLVDDMFNGKI